jgi:hypothetical protein
MAVIEIPVCPGCGGQTMRNLPYDERGPDYVEITCMERCGWEHDDPDLESRDT